MLAKWGTGKGRSVVIVSDSYMAFSIQKDVFGLEIPMHNSISMKMRYGRYNFSCIDSCKLLPCYVKPV
jgi:hypothetical protein